MHCFSDPPPPLYWPPGYDPIHCGEHNVKPKSIYCLKIAICISPRQAISRVVFAGSKREGTKLSKYWKLHALLEIFLQRPSPHFLPIIIYRSMQGHSICYLTPFYRKCQRKYTIESIKLTYLLCRHKLVIALKFWGDFSLDPSYTWPDVPPGCGRLPNMENVEKC